MPGNGTDQAILLVSEATARGALPPAPNALPALVATTTSTALTALAQLATARSARCYLMLEQVQTRTATHVTQAA